MPSFGGYGGKIIDMLKELRTFANRRENIREVFLIRFRNHRPNVGTNPIGNCNTAIAAALLQTLCEDVSDCLTVYQSSGSSDEWLSLAEMLRRGQRYVIVSDGSSDKPYIKSYEVREQPKLENFTNIPVSSGMSHRIEGKL